MLCLLKQAQNGVDPVILPKIIQTWEFIAKKIFAVENMITALELQRLVNATLIFVTLLRTQGKLFYLGFVKNMCMTFHHFKIDNYIRFYMLNVIKK